LQKKSLSKYLLTQQAKKAWHNIVEKLQASLRMYRIMYSSF
jgi:hypothetical protein